MSPEHRQWLLDTVEKHPNMRVSTLMAKIKVICKADQIRREIESNKAAAGITEGLIL